VNPAAASQGEARTSLAQDAVEVGRIVDAWGVKGWVKVRPFADDPQAIFSARHWHLLPPEPGGPRPPSAGERIPPQVAVVQVKTHGEWIVAQLDGIADRASAESLRGARICVSRASFPATDADEYYWVDLIGLSVVNLQGEALGSVAGLIDTGPHSVLRVAPPPGLDGVEPEERLIPFVGQYVTDVSMAERRITVDWGLDY
jgi:16S rRNA processing protein RimM